MSKLIGCHECDALQCLPQLEEGNIALCIRCGASLYRRKKNSVNRTLALALAGLVFFFIAQLFPFLSLETGGISHKTTLIGGILELYSQDYFLLATLVFLTSILLPFFEMCCLVYLLLPLRYNIIPRHFIVVLRSVRYLRPWEMTDIFMLGVLVSLVKLAKLANIVPGISLYAFACLIVVLTAAVATLDVRYLWDFYGKHNEINNTVSAKS